MGLIKRIRWIHIFVIFLRAMFAREARQQWIHDWYGAEDPKAKRYCLDSEPRLLPSGQIIRGVPIPIPVTVDHKGYFEIPDLSKLIVMPRKLQPVPQMNRNFKSILIIAGVILFLPGLLVLNRSRAFQKYICSPKPKGVTNVRYEDNGVFMMLFEPVVKIGFSAGRKDVSTILEKKQWQLIDEHSTGFPIGRDGPQWWKPHSGTLYHMVRPEVDVTEFLLIDQTGTNVFYLLWGK